MKQILSAFTILLLISACNNNDVLSDPSISLDFSEDTVNFDTIFTGFGSITKKLKVYNRNDGDINISEINLRAAGNSFFRLNIDGRPQNKLNDYTLRKKDSLYIFIELTIDQTDANNPFTVSDSIEFTVNGSQQFVPLIARGQNAHFFENEILDENTTWTNDKPYIIYGNLVVDTTTLLTVEEGVRVHLHRESSLVVNGSLHVNGTLENPVTFNTDRLETYYQDQPGQWGAIALLPGSSNNIINHALINSAQVALQIGSPYDRQYTELNMQNTIITNSGGPGIWAFGGTVKVHNLLVHSFTSAAVVINSGGDYSFAHCTFANQINSASASVAIQSPYLVENYWDDYLGQYRDIPFGGDIKQASFTNCILQGSGSKNGLSIINEGSNLFNYKFTNCIINADLDTADYDIDTNDILYFENNIWTDSLNFVSADSLNFRIDSGSVAIGRGTPEIFNTFPEAEIDLDGVLRNKQKPDIGAYRYTKNK